MEVCGQLCDIFGDAAYETIRNNTLTFFATQLQNFLQMTSDDMIDSMCFFCDFMQHTKAHDDTAMA